MSPVPDPLPLGALRSVTAVILPAEMITSAMGYAVAGADGLEVPDTVTPLPTAENVRDVGYSSTMTQLLFT
jgi:hypothetical protein